jgi:hypothetical protein
VIFTICEIIYICMHFNAEGKTASPSSEAWFNPGMARNVTVLHAFSSAFSLLLYMIFALFHYFVFWYFFSISFWFVLMFFHLIILNIFLHFIATDLLLVIVNSCLERHLPHRLLFVIANSTSILHACIEWFLVYDLCFILLFCVLIFF